MTDEPVDSLEQLVARRIREQLDEGRLRFAEASASQGESLNATIQPVTAQLSGHVGFAPGDIAVIESALPELARDIRTRSPQDISLAINIYMAIMQTLQLLLMVYQMVHGQPPSHEQIIEIFNHTTTVIHQTTTVVANMPPGHGIATVPLP